MSVTGYPLVNTLISTPLLRNSITASAETDTGYTHNSKTVYTKTYSGTTSATDGNDLLDTVIGLTHIVRIYGYFITSSNNVVPLNFVRQGTNAGEMRVRKDGNDISIRHADTENSVFYDVTVFYTK